MNTDAILDLKDIRPEDIERVGLKSVTLSQLMNAGIRVPDGFVVTFSSLNRFLEHNGILPDINGLNTEITSIGLDELAGKAKSIRDRIIRGEFPSDLKDQIKATYSKLGMSKEVQGIDNAMLGAINAGSNLPLVAVRSSVHIVDSRKISFTGFYRTCLFVSGVQGLLDSIKEVWASYYNDEAIYARQKYKGGQDLYAGVIIQKMIDADKTGICATMNPVTKNSDEVIIESSIGCGLTSSGDITPDIFLVNSHDSSIRGKKISLKEWKLVKHSVSGDIIKEKISPELKDLPSIDSKGAFKISETAKKIANMTNSPIYMQWACKRDQLYVLDANTINDDGEPIKDAYMTQIEPTLSGIGACSGTFRGKARSFHEVSDIVKIKPGNIIVSDQLSRQAIPVLNRAGGVILESGGMLSSMSVLCRELDIPLIVGCKDACENISESDSLMLDATSGRVYIESQSSDEMSSGLQEGYEGQVGSMNRQSPANAYESGPVPVDQEGQNRPVFQTQIDKKDGSGYMDCQSEAQENSNNDDMPQSLQDISSSGQMDENLSKSPEDIITGTKVKLISRDLQVPSDIFDGIGIIPSEIVLLSLGKHPYKVISEGMHGQLAKYIETKFMPMVEASYPKPVAFKLFSASTDILRRLPGSEHEPEETNPRLGWHGARRILDDPALFEVETDAIINMINKGYDNIQLIIPSVHDEAQIREIKRRLKDKGADMRRLSLGISIDVPAAGLMAHEFAREGIDFVYMDSDRLSESMLLMDPDNEKVSKHLHPKNKGVLRIINKIIKDYKGCGIKVNLSGSFLDTPEMIELAVKWGADSLVVTSDRIRTAKYLVARAERKMLLDVMRNGKNR